MPKTGHIYVAVAALAAGIAVLVALPRCEESARERVASDMVDTGADAVERAADSAFDLIDSFADPAKRHALAVEQELLPALSLEERRRLGQTTHDHLMRTSRATPDRGIRARASRLGRAVVAEVERLRGAEFTRLDYHFTALDEASPNAFAHVGGYVYVNTGLLDLLETDDQLTFVLAHEVGHVEHAHTCAVLATQKLAGNVAGDTVAGLARLAFNAVELNYTSARELEADAFGYEVATGLGVHPNSIRRVFELLAEIESPIGATPGNGDTVDRIRWTIENHFRTHPKATVRIDEIDRLESGR